MEQVKENSHKKSKIISVESRGINSNKDPENNESHDNIHFNKRLKEKSIK